MKRVIHTDFAEIRLIKPDMIRLEYVPGTNINNEVLKKILPAYRKLVGDKKIYLLSVIPAGMTFDKEINSQWTKKERSDMKKAEAFVMKGRGYVLMADFIRVFLKPKHEVQFFNSESKALAWLNAHKKKKP